MIPKECKRLGEMDFPIAEVSRYAVREKSIRHGHPSTLYLRRARRPDGRASAAEPEERLRRIILTFNEDLTNGDRTDA